MENPRNSLREFENMHEPRVFVAVLVPVSPHSDHHCGFKLILQR